MKKNIYLIVLISSLVINLTLMCIIYNGSKKINEIRNLEYSNYYIKDNIVYYHLKDNNKGIPIPQFSTFYGKFGMTSLIFYTPKDIDILKKELEEIFNSDLYEKIYSKNGNVYYYNRNDDYTITKYEIEKKQFINYFALDYHNGYIK